MKDLKVFLEQVLTIIDYKDNKYLFINEFINLCIQKTIAEYMNLLPENRKYELKQFLQESDPYKLKERLEPYIATEEYSKLFQENIRKLFKNYYETILPTLAEKQKNKLNEYLTSLTSEQLLASSENT